jgi:hypothetical protein
MLKRYIAGLLKPAYMYVRSNSMPLGWLRSSYWCYLELCCYTEGSDPGLPFPADNKVAESFCNVGYGARFTAGIYTRGCHWAPCLIASMAFISGLHSSYGWHFKLRPNTAGLPSSIGRQLPSPSIAWLGKRSRHHRQRHSHRWQCLWHRKMGGVFRGMPSMSHAMRPKRAASTGGYGASHFQTYVCSFPVLLGFTMVLRLKPGERVM